MAKRFLWDKNFFKVSHFFLDYRNIYFKLLDISRFGFNDLLDPEKVLPTITISSNEELQILNKSISYKYKMYSLIEMKKFDETIELGEKVHADFEKFRETKSEIFARNQTEKSFLRRYTITGNYMKAIKCLIDAYEKEKRWTKANQMLRFLIGLNFSLHRHGRWWIRIIINSGHLKEKIEKVEESVFNVRVLKSSPESTLERLRQKIELG